MVSASPLGHVQNLIESLRLSVSTGTLTSHQAPNFTQNPWVGSALTTSPIQPDSFLY